MRYGGIGNAGDFSAEYISLEQCPLDIHEVKIIQNLGLSHTIEPLKEQITRFP